MTLYRKDIPAYTEMVLTLSQRTDVSPFDVDGRVLSWTEVLEIAEQERMLVPVEPNVFWRLDFAKAEEQGNGERMNQMVDILIEWGWLDSVEAVPVAGIGDNDA